MVVRSAFISASAAALATLSVSPKTTEAQVRSILQIGNSGLEEQAQAIYADELGLYRRAGLNTEVIVQRGGAATVAAVLGGASQIGCANLISLGLALQKGLPFVMLLPAAIWDTKHPNAFTVVAPDSAIKLPKDLNGKVIGVGSLNGSSQIFLAAFIKQGGGDPNSVKFIEIPDSLVAEALKEGRIAASLLSEPMFSAAGSQVRSIGPPLDAVAPYFAQTVWFTTTAWLAQNKDVARSFIRATVDAGKWSMNNRVAAAAILEKRLGFKEDQTKMYYATVADPNLMQVFLDRAAEFKVLAPMRAADFSWNGK